ncbi:hypothetical protein HDU98_011773 [Podochytrium sp. JEL0797]|nr:hypothetical protein HDU98_011773 [Podochytrium sp. JEL0797]
MPCFEGGGLNQARIFDQCLSLWLRFSVPPLTVALLLFGVGRELAPEVFADSYGNHDETVKAVRGWDAGVLASRWLRMTARLASMGGRGALRSAMMPLKNSANWCIKRALLIKTSSSVRVFLKRGWIFGDLLKR